MRFLGIPGGLEIGLIILAIVLLFGGRKIPELMKGLGKGLGEFKKARAESEKDSVDTDESNEKDKLEK